MTAFLLRVCAVNSCLVVASHEYRHLTQLHHRALSASPGSSVALRQRRRRLGGHCRRVSRRRMSGSASQSLHAQAAAHCSIMALQHEVRRRASAPARRPDDSSESAAAVVSSSDSDATRATRAEATRQDSQQPVASAHSQPSGASPHSPSVATPPRPLQAQAAESRDKSAAPRDSSSTGALDSSSTEALDSSSTGALDPSSTAPLDPSCTAPPDSPFPAPLDSATPRTTNRLSLTLPIAPPTSEPSRPPPKPVSASSSVPPTPRETWTAASTSDVGDFIIEIAAQERRVLELREELGRAESQLASLKKKWTAKEAQIKNHGNHHAKATPSVTPHALPDDALAARRSLDLDRRKLLLQNQQQTQLQSTPTTTTANRRRVLRGGHTRTLSLLSPARPDDAFAPDECHGSSQAKRRSAEQFMTPRVNGSAKMQRQTWQPHSACNSPSVPQIVEDFKMGFKAFVEDIRQITVGDEPAMGHVGAGRGIAPPQHMGGTPNRSSVGHHGHASPWAKKGNDLARRGTQDAATPTPAGRSAEAAADKTKPTKSKRYSWTPLGLDSLDDGDWCHWETPVSAAKSPRWSGSTIHSPGAEDIGPIYEAGEESTTPVKTSSLQSRILPPRLDELVPSVVNRLSPHNLKQTANNLMNEWEKSLAAPDGKENDDPLS